MTEIAVIKALPEDADRLYEIECACFSTPWSRESLASFIADRKHAVCLAAHEDKAGSTGQTNSENSINAGNFTQPGNIIGYIGVMSVLDEGEITNIAVIPECRGKGVGFALLCAAKDYCRKTGIHTLHLEVRAGNNNALALYRKCGFIQTGMRRGYYADNGEDALLFSWKDV
ncbi:MAG: ribosomal protein S18-alanine N-acetyltransferase [Eubacteriales bacterium]